MTGQTLDLFADAAEAPHDRLALPARGAPADTWRRVAEAVRGWLRANRVEPRDAIVVVPFVQLIDPAREALAAAGGWLPRIETTRTLAEALGPPAEAAPGAPTGSAPVDRLLARQLLLGQAWAAQWARRDPRAFEHAIGRLVATVHELLRAIAATLPRDRERAWAALEHAVAIGGRRERDLSLVAVRWAALAPPPRSDALHALAPAAWIAVEAGGADVGLDRLLAASAAPTLTVVVDPPPAAPLAVAAGAEPPAFAIRPSFEDEAQAAAAQVLAHLREGERPVVLVAQDRLLARRARELLSRSAVAIADETGWRLSTTRAAARFMTLLRAARGDAGTDALFDWLKSGTRWAEAWPLAVAGLESRIRRSGASRLSGLATFDAGDGDPARLRDEALAVLASLRDLGRARLADWLDAATVALDACGGRALLAADAAGIAVLAALGLDLDADQRQRRQAAIADVALTLSEFTRWCDDVLEGETFRPDPGGGDADVHITPLARAMLRPFAAAVLPGADASRLGAWSAPESLLPRAAADAIGIASPEQRQARERLAFAHLVQAVPLTLLRRASDGAAPLGNSRYVDLLELSLAADGRELRDWIDPRVDLSVAARPTRRAAARAPRLVPARLSATSLEALRACPYRFFAAAMLGLREAEELDDELDKRVFGNWLHDVLLRFHAGRSAQPDDFTGLRAAAAAALADAGLDAADFLPWQASFDAFVPRYVAFMRERDAEGARWHAGEEAFTLALDEIGVELYGRVDRVDEIETDDGAALELIDYKAGGQSRWKDQAGLGFEDTQLAFYAALVRARRGGSVSAAYLALEGRPKLKLAHHRDVAASADALLAGVAVDVRRLREGAALSALGEGSICGWCEVRGLCRRDDWWPDDDPAAPSTADGAIGR